MLGSNISSSFPRSGGDTIIAPWFTDRVHASQVVGSIFRRSSTGLFKVSKNLVQPKKLRVQYGRVLAQAFEHPSVRCSLFVWLYSVRSRWGVGIRAENSQRAIIDGSSIWVTGCSFCIAEESNCQCRRANPKGGGSFRITVA